MRRGALETTVDRGVTQMKVFKNLFQRKSAPKQAPRELAREEDGPKSGEEVEVRYLDYNDLADTETSLKLKDIIRAKAEAKLKK